MRNSNVVALYSGEQDQAPVSEEEIARVLQLVEEGGEDVLTDDELAIFDALRPQLPDPNEDHHANLAEYLDESTLARIAQDVIQWYEWDEQSRSDWKEREAKGIKKLGVSENTEGGADFEGAAKVVHPLLAEACVQFQARAIAELWPAGGPVKTIILGRADDERRKQSDRVKGFMNYQYTQKGPGTMPGAFLEEDQLLFRLPLSGSCFVKVYPDSVEETVMRRFVDPNYFVVPYTATDLRTAPRYTHVLFETTNTVRKKVFAGDYRDLDLRTPSEDRNEDSSTTAVQDEIDAAEGRSPVSVSDDQRHTNLEMHVDYDLPGFEDTNGIALPYIITVSKDEQTVLSIRRNWRPNDPKKRKRLWFVHRRFLPGLGFYGFGYLHIIGGLADAATGALRALLDAAHFNNLPGGFRSKDAKLPNGNITIGPGEWAEVESTAEDLTKAFFKLPYEEPSMTLFHLLGHLSELGQRFASTTEAMVGEANNTGPVGTTLALIEQGLKVYSGIHKRQYEALAEEFHIVAELNGEVLPDRYPYEIEEEEQEVFRADFDGRIDVVPVADPNIVTSTQRIAQSQAVLQLSDTAPDLYDRRVAHRRMLEALQVPNIDELLPDQSQVPRMGPIEENMHVVMMHPVKAYPDQDHQAHMVVHQGWFMTLDPETQKRVGAAYFAHQAEHMAMDYLIKMQQAMGTQIPVGQEVPPEIENQIAMAAAQVTQLMAQQAQQLPNPDAVALEADQNRKDAAAQREQDRKDWIAERDVERKDAVAAADLAMKVKAEEARIMTQARDQGYE